MHLLLIFNVANKCTTDITQVYITTVYQCNLFCYWFRHVRVIVREYTTNVLLSYIPYFPAHKTHRDFFIRNFRKKSLLMYFNFSNLLEENRIVTYQN